MNELRALEAGSPGPLGARVSEGGIEFAVAAPGAEHVELCLFDENGAIELQRLGLPARRGDVWHGRLANAGAGLVYGYRVHGPYAPARGDRFNPHKLLLDPYARVLAGEFVWNDAVFGYDRARGPDSFDARDSAPYVPKCRVVAPPAPRERPPRPRIAWSDTVIYELHVRGYTRLHPQVPEHLRGRIGALAERAVIDHLRRIGVTAVELMPVTEFIDEEALVRRGLTNYWGYNPIAFFAPQRRYLCAGSAAEFADTVDRLHAAGIEVILDVVFNHTAESDASGPTLSLRGLGNRTYYLLDDRDPRRYVDLSGCGNTLDFTRPAVVALAHAALRYWALEIGVDGFRFDLALALAQDADGNFDLRAPIREAVRHDADFEGIKFIVEPWHAATREDHLGRYPAPIAEWNSRYRDSVRRFWRGDRGMIGEFASRFAGSGDIYAQRRRTPSASINFITAHDGFTLADLLAYRSKHNEANGDANRDGTDENYSDNGGAEGPTADPAIRAARLRRARSLLGTLLLSNGVPMLLAGDELSRTQHGNNNAYCQDNAISWLDWSACGDPARDLSAFVAQACALRRRLAALPEARFWSGLPQAPSGLRDVQWLCADASEMTPRDWFDTARLTLGILLLLPDASAAAGQVYIALNAGAADAGFRLPDPASGEWVCVLDSASAVAPFRADPGRALVNVSSGSLCVYATRVLATRLREEFGTGAPG